MHRDALTIHEPCDANWDEMTGDDARRHCAHCALDVHHLSAMTRREAERTLRGHGGHLCVRYQSDAAGHVQFEPRRVAASAPLEQQRGAALLVARAAAVTALLAGGAAGCDVAVGATAWAMAKGGDEIEVMMGEPIVEPEYLQGDVMPVQGGLEPYPYPYPGPEGSGDAEETIIQQEQGAAEQLAPYGITLEEEEIEGCEAPELEEAEVIEVPDPVQLMGRIAPVDMPIDMRPKPR